MERERGWKMKPLGRRGISDNVYRCHESSTSFNDSLDTFYFICLQAHFIIKSKVYGISVSKKLRFLVVARTSAKSSYLKRKREGAKYERITMRSKKCFICDCKNNTHLTVFLPRFLAFS